MMRTRPTRHMNKKSASDAEEGMTLSGHLKELRSRVIICVSILIISFFVGLNFAPRLVTFLTDMGKAYHYVFVTLQPAELLGQYFGIAFICAVIITLPVIIYHVWAFVKPGLQENENKIFLLVITFGLLFFILGVFFAYKIMLPFMLRFLIEVGKGTDIQSSISVASYLTFIFTIFIIFGIIFEMPVVTVCLTQLGLLKVTWLKKARKVVIVIIFLVSAIVTPPDAVSQVMTALPMIVLYQLSIGICSLLDRRRAGRQSASDQEDAHDRPEA